MIMMILIIMLMIILITVTMITERKYVESELSTFSGEEMKTWSIVTSR